MSKKLIYFTLVAFIFSIFSVAQGHAKKQKVYKLVGASFTIPAHRTMVIMRKWQEKVVADSGGRIKFENHYAGDLVSKKEQLDALGRGIIDFFCSVPTYFSGKVAIADIVLMPTNFKSWESLYDVLHRTEVYDIIDKVYQEKTGTRLISFLPIFSSENFLISKKAKRIVKFEDFKGMKIRAAGGIASETVKSIGGTPVVLLSTELYTGFQQGIVDGGLLTMYSLQTYKLWEVSSQNIWPSIFPYCTVAIWMNPDKLNSLPKDLQKIILDAARSPELEKWAIEYIKEADRGIEKTAKEKYNVEFYTLPEAEVEKMEKALVPVWDKYIANCEKQGLGEQARQIEKIVHKHYFSK